MRWPTLRWIGRRLKDLFYGTGNVHLDLGRVLSFFSILTPIAAAGYNMWLGKEIELQELGMGLAAVVTACAVLIKMKDAEARKAKATEG